MAKFKITYRSDHDPEEVQVTAYEDHADWIDFFKMSGPKKTQVLRVDARRLKRVELLP